jgi:hypothetical protein
LFILIISVDVFLPDWDMMMRQRRAGVNVVAYFVARNATDGVLNTLIPPMLFALLFYYFMELNMTFAWFYLIIVVTQFTCIGLGYMSSLVAQSVSISWFLLLVFDVCSTLVKAPFLAGCVLVLISIAFSGVQPTLAKLNAMVIVGFLSHFSFARWAVEAIYISEGKSRSYCS